MKKLYFIILSSLLLTFSVNTNAQNPIPNNSFENWQTEGMLFFQTEVPVGWKCMSVDIDTFGMQISIPLGALSKTADAQDGNYAVLLETKNIDPSLLMGLEAMGVTGIDIMPSIMTIGGINMMSVATNLLEMLTSVGDDITSLLQTFLTANLSDYFYGGMPLNGMVPAALEGYYKYETGATTTQNGGSGNGGGGGHGGSGGGNDNDDNDEVGDDAAMIMLIGSRYDATQQRRVIAGVGAGVLNANNGYSEFEVQYNSLPFLVADTMEIIILSSQLQTMTNGSKLYLDNLSLRASSSVMSADVENQVNCYPNPTNGEVVLQLGNNSPAKVIFYNTIGQKVIEQKDCTNHTRFYLPEAGTYIMEVIQNNHHTFKTIIVK